MKSVLIFLLLTSCTITLVNTSTNGRSSDVVDTDSKADATVTPTVSLPVLP